MAYLDYPGLAYFKSLLDQTYLRVDYDGDTTIAGHVTFTNPITGDIDGRAKKDWLGQQFDTTYLKDIQPDESGALKLILGNGEVSHLVTDTTVTQERSNANETYPILLCYDENATADQIAKKVKYGHDVQINPAYGYIYTQGYVEKHPAYNRTTAQSSRAEWMFDFRDSVLNPVGQIYSYVDPSNQGGEHRMELRLYGNPHTTSLNLPNYNFETDTVSLGVSSTKGDKLTFFGYAPSTPIYLENGTTMRKSTVRGDQYGRDIITRDWLNLNGSITGLVHTYMDETIDGYKTFLKTVTIDSGNDNAKAGLNVQGDVNIDSGDASKPSNFYVQGNSHIHGNEDIDGNLNVDGTSDQHGNVHMYHNLDVDGNANTDGNQTVGGTLTVTGKITGNGGAEISGGSGLKVNGNETVTGNLTVGGTTTTEDLTVTDDATIGDDLTVNGDELVKGNETVNGNSNVGGTINKVSGGTTQEYVTYVTNQAATRKNIAANLVDTTKGLAYNTTTGKIYINAANNKGIAFDSNGKLFVDFSQIDDDTKAEILNGLDMQIPLKANKSLIVNKATGSDSIPSSMTVATRASTPFKTIQACVNWATSTYAVGRYTVYIKVVAHTDGYTENVTLPDYNGTTGKMVLCSNSGNKDVVIKTPQGSNGTSGWCINNTGSIWEIDHLICEKHIYNHSIADDVSGCIQSSNSGSQLYVKGCDFKLVSHSANGNAGTIRMIAADTGGRVALYADDAGAVIYSNASYAIAVHVLVARRTGVISFWRSGQSLANRTFACSGSCTHFCHADNNASINNYGAGDALVFSGSVTGVRFSMTMGSSCNTGSGSDTYFPGNEEGTVQTSTYCWYY